jgi:hypothetical protein
VPAGRIRTAGTTASVPLAADTLAEALSNVYDVEAKKIAFIVAEDGKILKTVERSKLRLISGAEIKRVRITIL